MTKEEAIKILEDEIKDIRSQIYTSDLETTIWVENRVAALRYAIDGLKGTKYEHQ